MTDKELLMFSDEISQFVRSEAYIAFKRFIFEQPSRLPIFGTPAEELNKSFILEVGKKEVFSIFEAFSSGEGLNPQDDLYALEDEPEIEDDTISLLD